MKAERQYLAHYIDAAFDTTYKATEYVRLGKDLEDFSIDLSPDVETSKNILGENSVKHKGYEATSSADPVYYEYDDTLTEKMMKIAMLRQKGDACKTSYVEVLLKPAADGGAPTVVRATRQDCYVIPTSYGGDTSGVQVPFEIRFTGALVEGAFAIDTKTFTPNT